MPLTPPIILGILALSSLLITIILAAFRKQLKIKSMKPHKTMAVITFVIAAIHAAIIFNRYMF